MNARLDGSTIISSKFSSLLSILRHRAQNQGEQISYTYLKDGETEANSLTYQQLEKKARVIAAKLQSLCNFEDRALLLYPPGLEFVEAFFGCLCAGVVAVPVYPPRPNHSLARVEAIVSDAKTTLVLTTASTLQRLEQQFSLNPKLSALQWVTTDTLSDGLAGDWEEPPLSSDSLAFLQYTSGSTGNPKGVMVSHRNLLHNSAFIQTFFEHSSESIGVIWLPPYHDMGLIGGVIQPLYRGGPVVLISPMHFLQRPIRWLMAITRYRATTSGGPNFAYDLCVRKITPKQRAGLDLTSWNLAFSGSEPVRAETLDRFTQAFESCGFDSKAFYPCYGLAESTLMVSGGTKEAESTKLTVDSQALEANRVAPVTADQRYGRTLIGCGNTISDQRVLIVHSERKIPCDGNEIGEIWVAGPSVAQGYWNRAEETEHTFRATMADTGEGPFLRTGDLGFMHEGELFVTGRLKDTIVIHGRNHYPHDIELTVEKSHDALSAGSGTAFSIDVEGEERLVVVQEVERKHLRDLDADAVMGAIRRSVSKEHDLQVYAVLLLKTSSIPKTSSGKVRRDACRDGFLDGSLHVVAQSVGHPQIGQEKMPFEDTGLIRSDMLKAEDPGNRMQALDFYFREQIASILGISSSTIDPQRPLDELGIDSLMSAELKTRIETDLGVELPIEALFQGASISDFVAHILGKMKNRRSKAKDGPLTEKLSISPQKAAPTQTFSACANPDEIQPECFSFEDFPEYRNLRQIVKEMKTHRIVNPYFKVYEGINCDTAIIGERQVISYSSYNYLGLSGHPVVSQAAKESIERYGTSVSASRIASGERPLHRELEKELSDLVGAEDCIVYVGGHATNVTTIGHLFGKHDLIVHDSLIHNSILQGSKLSGASQLPFPHNDWQILGKILHDYRNRFRRVLVVIEGVYSMDGDIPDLPEFMEVKKRYKAFLMVDEAHSIGVLGKKGRGIAEHFGVNPNDVDLWMGTLSKAFASCGGYICGYKALIEYLKYTAPGFVYSVGISPVNAAAALAAIRLLKGEPERVTRLHERAKFFLDLARARGLNTGTSGGSPIIPVIVGNSLGAMHLSQALFRDGIDVLPMVYPAVPDKAARLRFFINCTHTEEQIRFTVDTVARELGKIMRRSPCKVL